MGGVRRDARQQKARKLSNGTGNYCTIISGSIRTPALGFAALGAPAVRFPAIEFIEPDSPPDLARACSNHHVALGSEQRRHVSRHLLPKFLVCNHS